MDTKAVHKLSLVMTAFRTQSPTMTVQLAHTFLLVASNEGKSISEIATLSGFRFPTVSRNILDLGVRNRKREPGLGLVETVIDQMELRRKNVQLTAKGRALVNQLFDILKA